MGCGPDLSVSRHSTGSPEASPGTLVVLLGAWPCVARPPFGRQWLRSHTDPQVWGSGRPRPPQNPKGAARTAPPFGRDFPAAGAAQTPKIDDLRSTKVPCIRNPGVLNTGCTPYWSIELPEESEIPPGPVFGPVLGPVARGFGPEMWPKGPRLRRGFFRPHLGAESPRYGPQRRSNNRPRKNLNLAGSSIDQYGMVWSAV